MNAPLWYVRFRPGVVGETRRVCHCVPVPTDDEVPTNLNTLCQTTIRPGEAELLNEPVGMPCTTCLMQAASTVNTELPTDSRHGE
jgi:hypothetical protein